MVFLKLQTRTTDKTSMCYVLPCWLSSVSREHLLKANIRLSYIKQMSGVEVFKWW